MKQKPPGTYWHFSLLKNLTLFRIGYTSLGGFTISHCNPIPGPPSNHTVTTAYLLHCLSAKLDAKDGIVSKSSGMHIKLLICTNANMIIDPFIDITIKPVGYHYQSRCISH